MGEKIINDGVEASTRGLRFVLDYSSLILDRATVYFMEWSHGLESGIGAME